ncbi:MAG TPA: ABC transporter ATP-binding protein, partial [Propionibacteriaceae bacterium]
MTDLQTGLRGSAETWQATPPAPEVPEELLPPRSGSVGSRLRAWRQRHLLRQRRAEEFFAASRNPDRGLPVADRREVGAFASRLLGARRFMITALLVLHALAALAGLVVPRILGSLVDKMSAPGTVASTVDAIALAVTSVIVLQAILTFFALRMSTIFGQDLLAEAREYVVRTVLGLPLSKVESASTGDLVTRVTRDVSTMSMSVRFGLPESVIAGMTTLLTVVAMLLNSPLLTLPLLVTAPLLIIAARRYIKRAPKGYITEGGTYSQINTTFTETVEGARTVEALGLQRTRIERGDSDIAVSGQAERYTMSLRNLLFIVIGFAYDTPLVMVLVLGAIGYTNGWVSLGQVTAATLYVQALVEPLDRLIRNVDRLQVGIASTCRLLGIA